MFGPHRAAVRFQQGALPYLRQQGFRPKLSSSLNIKVKHTLLDYTHDRTPVTTYAPVHSGTGPPSAEDSAGFVSLVERQLDTQRPDVIVTYGGGKFVAPTRGVLQAAAARGIPVVFWLRNEHYAYDGYKAFFDLVAGTIVPSPFLRGSCAATLQATVPIKSAVDARFFIRASLAGFATSPDSSRM